MSVDTRWWPLIVSRDGVTQRFLLQSLLVIALVSPQALIHSFDGLPAGATAGALAYMRVHSHHLPPLLAALLDVQDLVDLAGQLAIAGFADGYPLCGVALTGVAGCRGMVSFRSGNGCGRTCRLAGRGS